MMKVISPYPPTIIRLQSKNIVISDGKWIEVDESVTLADLDWVNSHAKYKSEKLVTKVVNGSKGQKYTVTKLANGKKTCTCTGYTFRKKCKHLDEL